MSRTIPAFAIRITTACLLTFGPILAMATVGLVGCGADEKKPQAAGQNTDAAGNAADGSTSDGGAAAKDAPTWHKTVGPIITKRCAGCHRDNGLASFRLDRPGDWAILGKSAIGAIEAGRMPPWPADSSCGSFAKRGDMLAAEITTVRAWVDAGMPAGDIKNAPAQPKPVKITPTHSLPMAKSFTPPKDALDTYRCFFLDLDTSKEDLFLRGSQVIPGADAIVHHVLIYSLEGQHIALAKKAAKKETEPGYACFGGPLPNTTDGKLAGFANGFPNQIAAWVPGLQARVMPADYAIRIKKGSRLVMQVHYNVAGGETAADITRLDVVVNNQPPKRLIVTRPLVIQKLDIQAGNKAARHEQTFRYYGKNEVRIHSLTPHMHLLGSRFKAEIHRKDGGKECALSVPKWDFNWQRAYARPEKNPLVLNSGDGLSLECVFDNSQENQPHVEGKQVKPRNVAWGDGSLDEMCLLYLDMSVPYTPGLPAGAAPCTGIDSCQKTCDPKDPLSCVYGCDATEAVCGTCVIGKLVSCAGASCAGAMLGAQQCLTNCLIGSLMLDANAGTCLETQCGDKWAKVQACVNPKVAKGSCDAELKACGVSFGGK